MKLLRTASALLLAVIAVVTAAAEPFIVRGDIPCCRTAYTIGEIQQEVFACDYIYSEWVNYYYEDLAYMEQRTFWNTDCDSPFESVRYVHYVADMVDYPDPAVTWTPWQRVYGSWGPWSQWNPVTDPATVWEDQNFSRSQSRSRPYDEFLQNECGEVEYGSSGSEPETNTETVWGTKPLNWHQTSTVYQDWHESGDWSPNRADYYPWEIIQQIRNRVRIWAIWHTNDRGDMSFLYTQPEYGHVYQTVAGTKPGYASRFRVELPGGGSVRSESGAQSGATVVTLPGGGTVFIDPERSGAIFLPGGSSVTIGADGSISVSGIGPLSPGTTITTVDGTRIVAPGPNAGGGVWMADGTVVVVGRAGIVEVRLPGGSGVGMGDDGLATVTLPSGTTSIAQIATDPAAQQIANGNGVIWVVREVINAAQNIYGVIQNLPSGGVGNDILISETGRFQIGVIVGTQSVVWSRSTIVTEQRILLLLHGMNSSTRVWDEFVSLKLGTPAPDILYGVMPPAPANPNAHGVRCYRVQFGTHDPVSGRVGVEGITANNPDYMANFVRCGDFQTFKQLGDEVEAAVYSLRQIHKNARIIILAHSRGGLAAREFLQRSTASSAEKAAVVGVVTTSSPHKGSRLGRIQSWLESHPRSMSAYEDDWEVVDFLLDDEIYNVLGKETLDVRRPTIGDLADNSLSIAALNSPEALARIPASTVFTQIVYDRAVLGTVANGYTIFDVAGGDLFEQVTDECGFFLLGSGNTATTWRGDGIVHAASQTFSTLPGAGFLSTPPIIFADRNILHTQASKQLGDMTLGLRQIAPQWFLP